MAGFSIIIVTWNGLHHLKTFLPSVASTAHDDFEIILADNASDDGTREWIKAEFPSVKIAALDKNYGYCGGNNRAAEYAEKEILLFLNNDVEVAPGWLTDLSRVFDEHADVGAAQPKILDYNRRNYFEYAGAAGGLLDRMVYPFCRGRIFDTVEEDTGQYDDEADIFWASGAALAVRKDTFEELGGFDEDFEFHMEEIDLCWRLQRAGYRVIYTPKSTVWHLGGGSLAMGSPRKVYYNFRNSLFMMIKNMPASQLCYKIPLRINLDQIAAAKALFSGRFHEFFAISKAHLHFFLALSGIRHKRKKDSLPRPKNLPGQANILLIWQYFVRGRKKFGDLDL